MEIRLQILGVEKELIQKFKKDFSILMVNENGEVVADNVFKYPILLSAINYFNKNYHGEGTGYLAVLSNSTYWSPYHTLAIVLLEDDEDYWEMSRRDLEVGGCMAAYVYNCDVEEFSELESVGLKKEKRKVVRKY